MVKDYIVRCLFYADNLFYHIRPNHQECKGFKLIDICLIVLTGLCLTSDVNANADNNSFTSSRQQRLENAGATVTPPGTKPKCMMGNGILCDMICDRSLRNTIVFFISFCNWFISKDL